MNVIEHRLIRGPTGPLEIDYLRVNEWRWTGHGINNLVIPEDSKILIEITGTGELRVFRPEGWQLIPVEPTSAMLAAGCELQSFGDETLYRDDMRLKWKAMLDAAPSSDKGKQ